MTSEIITIISVAITVMLAMIAGTWKISNSINGVKLSFTDQIGRIKSVQNRQDLKIDTLWEVYGEEAIREARTHGFTESRSPDHVTEKAIALLTDSMYNTLVISGNHLLEIESNPKEVAFQLFVDNKEVFEKVSEENNIPLKVFVGISRIIIDRCLDSKLGNV